jgi:hypothetical protein
MHVVKHFLYILKELEIDGSRLWTEVAVRLSAKYKKTSLCLIRWLVGDYRNIGGFHRDPGVPTYTTDRHDIAEQIVESGVKHHNPTT